MYQELEDNHHEYLKEEVKPLWEILWGLDWDLVHAIGLSEFDKRAAVTCLPRLATLYLEGEPVVLPCHFDNNDDSFSDQYHGYDIIVFWSLIGRGDGTQKPQRPGYEVWIYPDGQAFIEEFIGPSQFKFGWTEQCEITQPKREIMPKDLPRVRGLVQHIEIIYNTAWKRKF